MKKKLISIVAIVLGIIIMAFTIMGSLNATTISGLAIVLMSIWLLLVGMADVDYSTVKSTLNTILGLVVLIIGLGIMLSPSLFGFLNVIVLYLAGIILMISGLLVLIEGRHDNFSFWSGVIGIVLGIIYIILAIYSFNVVYSGFLVGIWLILTGVLRLK